MKIYAKKTHKNLPETKEALLVRLANHARMLRKSRDRALRLRNTLAEPDVFAARMNGEIAGLEYAYELIEQMGDFLVEKPAPKPRRKAGT